jgi:predicted acylesterase/phospholipase RssA
VGPALRLPAWDPGPATLELTLDVLMASCCLPKLHHPAHRRRAVLDGGYSANSAVFPFSTGSSDRFPHDHAVIDA